MKKQVTELATICDLCGSDNCYSDTCFRCGKDFCGDCSRENTVTYQHERSVAGYGDGHYCVECDAILRAEQSDPLHNAYVAFKAILDEMHQVYVDQSDRARNATMVIKREFDKRGAAKK